MSLQCVSCLRARAIRFYQSQSHWHALGLARCCSCVRQVLLIKCGCFLTCSVCLSLEDFGGPPEFSSDIFQMNEVLQAAEKGVPIPRKQQDDPRKHTK